LAGNPAPEPDRHPRHALVKSSAGIALFAWRLPSQPRFDQDDRDLLSALAMPVAALQMEAARQVALDVAARSDPLTGLLNRFAFDEGLAHRLAVGATGCLLFLDLDGLKPLNDQLGHEAGDAALRAMAARLLAVAGPGDLAARLGGDEFCLWLEGEREAEASARAADLGTPGPIQAVPQAGPEALRASLGLVERRVGEAAGELIARADAAMYVVKRQRGEGRGAVAGTGRAA
jgi:diguanylate cyclase (GGDEF)-like protein